MDALPREPASAGEVGSETSRCGLREETAGRLFHQQIAVPIPSFFGDAVDSLDSKPFFQGSQVVPTMARALPRAALVVLSLYASSFAFAGTTLRPVARDVPRLRVIRTAPILEVLLGSFG